MRKYTDCLPEGTDVIVHSLGEEAPEEYRGVVRGVSFLSHTMPFYIVEMVDNWREPGYLFTRRGDRVVPAESLIHVGQNSRSS